MIVHAIYWRLKVDGCFALICIYIGIRTTYIIVYVKIWQAAYELVNENYTIISINIEKPALPLPYFYLSSSFSGYLEIITPTTKTTIYM